MLQRLIPFAVVVRGVNEHATHRSGHIIARQDRVCSIPEGIVIASGIRIEQHLIPVVAVSLTVKIRRTICTEGIVHSLRSRIESSQVDMPEFEGSIALEIELDCSDG